MMHIAARKCRTLAATVGLLLGFAVSPAHAQTSGKMWRIGVLMPERPGAFEEIVGGLRDLQYIEGRNTIFEVRRAKRSEQFPALAADLVRSHPDVVVAVSGTAALALRTATKTIPIVMATSGDAVSQGLVASLARPGGNVTGFTVISPDLVAKRLQILKEAVPRAKRIGVLGCPREGEAVNTRQWAEVQRAAKAMQVQLVQIFIRRIEELPASFARAAKQGIDAVLVFDCSVLNPPESVTGLLNDARVPAIYAGPRFVQVGGLMSYGANSIELYRRSATFVDKILKGAKPADLPVEQPTRFELTINRKTAASLGVSIPPALQVRVDLMID